MMVNSPWYLKKLELEVEEVGELEGTHYFRTHCPHILQN